MLSHAGLSERTFPPEAVCGRKRKGKEAIGKDADEYWYPNHPYYEQDASNPREPPRMTRLPRDDPTMSFQRAVADTDSAHREESYASGEESYAPREESSSSAKKRASDIVKMPPPSTPPKSTQHRASALSSHQGLQRRHRLRGWHSLRKHQLHQTA